MKHSTINAVISEYEHENDAHAFRLQAHHRIEEMEVEREMTHRMAERCAEDMEAERHHFRRQAERHLDEMESYRHRLFHETETRHQTNTNVHHRLRKWAEQRHRDLGADIHHFKRREDDRFRELGAEIQSFRRQERVRDDDLAEDIRRFRKGTEARYHAMLEAEHPRPGTRTRREELPRPRASSRFDQRPRRQSFVQKSQDAQAWDRGRCAEQLESWASKVEASTQERGKHTKVFCPPPFTDCDKCAASKPSCRCSLPDYLKSLGHEAVIDYAKRMRRCLHPDRYTACEYPDVQKRAAALFTIFEHVADRL